MVRRKTTRNILIFTLVIFVLIGITLFLYLKEARADYHKEVAIEVNGTTTVETDMEGINLLPGQESEYAIDLRFSLGGDYSLTVDFSEIRSGGLEDLFDVELSCDGTVVKNKLSAMLKGDSSITFDRTVKDHETKKIIVRYTLPESVGNEVQNSFADLKIGIVATYQGRG